MVIIELRKLQKYIGGMDCNGIVLFLRCMSRPILRLYTISCAGVPRVEFSTKMGSHNYGVEKESHFSQCVDHVFFNETQGVISLGCKNTLPSCDLIFVCPKSTSVIIIWIHSSLSLYFCWSFPHSRCLYLAMLKVMIFIWDHSWSLSSTFWMTSVPSIEPPTPVILVHLKTCWGFTKSLLLSLMKVLNYIGPWRKSWGTPLLMVSSWILSHDYNFLDMNIPYSFKNLLSNSNLSNSNSSRLCVKSLT